MGFSREETNTKKVCNERAMYSSCFIRHYGWQWNEQASEKAIVLKFGCLYIYCLFWVTSARSKQHSKVETLHLPITAPRHKCFDFHRAHFGFVLTDNEQWLQFVRSLFGMRRSNYMNLNVFSVTEIHYQRLMLTPIGRILYYSRTTVAWISLAPYNCWRWWGWTTLASCTNGCISKDLRKHCHYGSSALFYCTCSSLGPFSRVSVVRIWFIRVWKGCWSMFRKYTTRNVCVMFSITIITHIADILPTAPVECTTFLLQSGRLCLHSINAFCLSKS